MPEPEHDPLPLPPEIEERTPHQSDDVVRDGGIARDDSAAADVSRDTYGSPLGPGGTGAPPTTDNDAR
jgi:hypothetical protein